MLKNKYLHNYWKTLICDVDDTLSVSITHDWENATPNYPVINKINKLHDDGWTIILMTARGQISCEGDFQKADEKYREKMESWLNRYEVKYHMLSFEKYLASYYIDDKSLTPQQFVELDIRDLQIGLSGAKVEKRGDRVFKTPLKYPESLNEAKWYNMAAPLINVPVVYNVIGNTIALQYLEDNGKQFKIEDVNNVIRIFSLYRTYVPFEKYIEKIKGHCDIHNDFHEIISLLKCKEEYFNKYNTFCHGDLSIQNIVQTDNGMYLIDPLWREDLWSSYLLDISKMMHSYRKCNRMFEYEVFLNGWVSNNGLDEYSLKLLEITQFIRVLKYLKNDIIKEEYKQIIKQLLSHIIK